jgi:hypothetical protein
MFDGRTGDFATSINLRVIGRKVAVFCWGMVKGDETPAR